MTVTNISVESQAYVDGFKAGRTDRRIGIKSEYVWFGVNDLNDYVRHYARGYRIGWLNLPF